MSAIIKSGNVGGLAAVRPFTPTAPHETAATIAIIRPDPELERLRQRVVELESDVHGRDNAVAGLRADVERAYQDGREKGHAQGLAEAEDRQSARLAVLERAIHAARSELSSRMASLDQLSVRLSQECLDIILGDRTARADLMHRIIALQINRLDKSMLLQVEVSPEDFADGSTLQELVEALGLPATTVRANSEMASGSCSMSLRLGKIDIGIDQQWGTLSAVLDELVLPGGRQ